jgi:hypothetical protein
MAVCMAEYEIFGGRLRSEMDLPELREVKPGSANWTFRVAHERPPLLDPITLGEERLVDTVSVRLERAADRYRLSFDDTGAFDVAADGGEITWYPASSASSELARVDLLGRVLSLAVHAQGDVSLHASAVVHAGRAIAFLGMKGRGKSTLALALVSAGARLLTDDTLRVRLADACMATPGLHSARLWHDAADALGRRDAARLEPDGDKLVVDLLDDDEMANASAPLDALYLLAPISGEGGSEGVRRLALASLPATLGILPHTKIAPLLGGTEAGAVMERMAALVRRVPVFALDIPRDLRQLPEIACTILGWHLAPAA